MKKITINNTTTKNLAVNLNDNRIIVEANSRQVIETHEKDTLQIFKNREKLSRYCVAKYKDNDSVGHRIWIMLILWLSLDLYIDVEKAPKCVTISEKHYHFYTVFMLSLLVVNGENEVKYDYHSKSDKKKLLLSSLSVLIPMAILCIVLSIVSPFALFTDFSAFSIVLCVFAIGLDCVFVSIIKSLLKYRDLNKNISDIIKNSRQAWIYSDNGRTIYFDD